MIYTLTKQDVLAAIDGERANWEALVAEIDQARMEAPDFAGGWSFKDIVAHIMAWRTRGIDVLEAAAKGLPEPPNPWPSDLQEDDEINAWFYERDRNLPLADVLQSASNSYVRLYNAVALLSDEALTDPNWFGWTENIPLGQWFIDRTYFGHLHDEHEANIRAWIVA